MWLQLMPIVPNSSAYWVVLQLELHLALVCCRFDLPYACIPIPAEQLRAWEEPDEALAKTLSLPPRNHYVPTDFSLHSSSKPLEQSLQAANAAAVALMQKLPSQVCYKVCSAIQVCWH